MIGLLQRVSQAKVVVADQTIGEIGVGLLVLICAERGDSRACAQRLLEKILSYRVFGDANGKMNCSLRDIRGGLLLVPQFTLAADTQSGTRPSFTPAAPAQLARELFEYVAVQAKLAWPQVAFGQFGADMQVHLVNNGPVTFWLHVPAATAAQVNPGQVGPAQPN